MRQIYHLDAAVAHRLKAKSVGNVPEITVWVDCEPVWLGKDQTKLGPSEGILVALDTEFSTVTEEEVRVTQLE